MLRTAAGRVVPNPSRDPNPAQGYPALHSPVRAGVLGPDSPGPAAGITRWCSRLPFPELPEQRSRARGCSGGSWVSLMTTMRKMFPTSPLVPRLSAGRDGVEVLQDVSLGCSRNSAAPSEDQPLSPDCCTSLGLPRPLSQCSRPCTHHILRDKPTQEQHTLKAFSQGIASS